MCGTVRLMEKTSMCLFPLVHRGENDSMKHLNSKEGRKIASISRLGMLHVNDLISTCIYLLERPTTLVRYR